MKRLGIFVFYDKQGKVDRYIECLLKGIQEHLSRLVIVCNGLLEDEGRKIFSRYSDEIYVRENSGYDAMAYKLALTDYIGWEQVDQYDEVLLFNDTFYGPIYPFSEMFEKMDKEQCDFWGITCERQFNDYMFGTDTVTPTHIHTYFCVYRKSAVMNAAFRDYWNAFDSTEWFFSDVCKHEMAFTKVLEDGGLEWKTYVELPEYHDDDMLDASVNPYYSLAYDIIKYYRCPILKRKNFIIKNLSFRTGTGGEDTRKSLEYVTNETDYNEDFIWENILRLYNIYEIKNALHLDYVLPWKHRESTEDVDNKKSAVIVWAQEDTSLYELQMYIDAIRECCDVIICSSYEEMKMSMVGVLKNYEYMCCISMEKINPRNPITQVKSLNYNLLECAIKSSNYICNLMSVFEDNPRLGVLVAPNSVHGKYLHELNNLWEEDYKQVVELIETKFSSSTIAQDIPCMNSQLVIWCRSEIVKPVIDILFEYEPRVIAKAIPYIAQEQGYYTGTVTNTDWASLQLTNLTFELTGLVQKSYKEHSFTDYNSIFESDMEAMVSGYKYVAIYGAGANGIKASNLFRKKGISVQGFIVSDDQPKQSKKNGLSIYRLSEFPYPKEETIIIISVAYARSRNAIVKNLIDRGYENYRIL